MTHNKTTRAFFSLLRAGLWVTAPDELTLFPLNEKEWMDVFKLSMKQTVTGIVLKGVLELPEELFPQEGLMIRWIAQVGMIEDRNKRMNRELTVLIDLFRKDNIDYCLQKGQGIAQMYENALWRECGDIDLYLPLQVNMKKAIEMAKGMGCKVEKSADGSYCFGWNEIEVEYHNHLFDIQNPFLKGYLSQLMEREGFVDVRLSEDSDTLITTPAPILNLLLLNTHIMKHVFGHGIGMRQLCDMARAYYYLHKWIDKEELKSVYSKVGIEKWSGLLHDFLIVYLGLDLVYLPDMSRPTNGSDELLSIIMEGGNFGFHNSGRSDEHGSKWGRKWQTAKAFYKQRNFSARYAPKEAFWTSVNLVLGQFKGNN